MVDYSILKIFGCLAYVHMQSEEQSKLHPSQESIYVLVWSFVLRTTGYRNFKEKKLLVEI
jgi:hypothetical protein